MSLVRLDQSEPDKPRDSVALQVDEKPQRASGGALPPRLLSGSGDSRSVYWGSVHAVQGQS
jgi:hypothetical protein